MQAALDRFGRIDVLVNNAGNFYAGFFEELTPEQIERSLTTNLVGPMNVTRAVLPVLRKQRSGNVVTITSTAGIVGQEFCSAYAAAKFGLEGWMESLRFEVEPLGIQTTIVEPGFFRTDLLTKESTAYADLSIGDYAERTAQARPAWEAMNGKQGGDPRSSRRLWSPSSNRNSRRFAGLQAWMRSRPSSRRPTTCLRRSMPTATYRRRSPSTRPKPEVRRSSAVRWRSYDIPACWPRRLPAERGKHLGSTFLGAPPHDNLPAGQGLKAGGGTTNVQGPLAYPCSSEAKNRHGERHVLRMPTWNADELTDDVQGNASVEAPFPARDFAEDVPWKGAAHLINAVYVPPGRAVRIERGVNSERGGPCQTEIASAGIHDGRAPAIDGRHH